MIDSNSFDPTQPYLMHYLDQINFETFFIITGDKQ